MKSFDEFDSVPVGAVIALPSDEARSYEKDLAGLPPGVLEMLSDTGTGAYIRGLVKGQRLPEETSQIVALAIFRVAVGRESMVRLPSILSTELKLPNDQAQKMVQEIERDLLGSVMGDIRQLADDKKSGQTGSNRARRGVEDIGLPNVLDLKDQNKLPPAPPMPKGR